MSRSLHGRGLNLSLVSSRLTVSGKHRQDGRDSYVGRLAPSGIGFTSHSIRVGIRGCVHHADVNRIHATHGFDCARHRRVWPFALREESSGKASYALPQWNGHRFPDRWCYAPRA
ncbi:hypothetical protein FW320_00500 [Azospirillum sp. Vi22]|uniref:hypothetical protein n=1 Tax=Azospirillum baldaniorum TaxID=1064539 RepID=UPI00157B93C1|nr:hypothetical protein [Azospirillum baldaniorum]NUB04675.1 hypothetical protein [Azospirillum baldaniorum]